MRRATGAATCWSRSSTSATGAWCCSTRSIPGAVPGYPRGRPDSTCCRRAIDSAGERFLLVSFHHHPVPIGGDWIDPIGLRNPQALGSTCQAPYPQLRCPHEAHSPGVRPPARPAAPVGPAVHLRCQFAPGSSDSHPSTAWRAYRWLAPARRRAPGNGDLAGRRRRLQKWTTIPPDTSTCPRSRDTAATCGRCRSGAGWEDEAWKLLPFGFPAELKPISPFPMTADPASSCFEAAHENGEEQRFQRLVTVGGGSG